MSISSLSTGSWLPFARTPLVLAASLSACLHTALVMAFVLTPDALRVPEPPRLTEVSIGPEITSAPDLPPPQIVPLPDTKPEESVAQDENKLAIPPIGAVERQASLPSISDPVLPPAESAEPSPLPQLPATAPASAPSPSLPDSIPDIAADEVKPVTPNASQSPRTDTATIVGSVVPPDISGVSSPTSSIADAKPNDAQTAVPTIALPLFPPEARGEEASPLSMIETLSLPVISSDDGNSPAPELTPQLLNAADAQSVTDTGPDGEATRSDAGSLRNGGRARTVLPPKRPAAATQNQQTSSSRQTPSPRQTPSSRQAAYSSPRSRSEVYDPGVRVRYSGNLFAHLRRKLVFPTEGPSGTTTVRFILDRSGRILQSGVVGSSGSPELDAQALSIVQRAAPFPRFPDGFGSSQLEVTLPVTFKGQ